jgi:CheY-like chemotaxis protein
MVKKVCYIIDDDKIVHFLTKHIFKLSYPDWDVLPFFNGKEALNCMNSGQIAYPDLILLDINMPVMDGWEFLDQFKEDKELEMPQIAIVSSSVDPRDKARINNYPQVTHYLLKPLTKEQIATLFETHK